MKLAQAGTGPKLAGGKNMEVQVQIQGWPGRRRGTLSTDRAESSYGLPVLVGDDGVAYGTAEIPVQAVIVVPQDAVDMLQAAGQAGYHVRLGRPKR